MTEVYGALFAAFLSLTVSLIAAFLQWTAKKRAEQRKKESLLSLELTMANNYLTYACAMALKRGHTNGEVETAIEAFDNAKKKYDSLIHELAADNLR